MDGWKQSRSHPRVPREGQEMTLFVRPGAPLPYFPGESPIWWTLEIHQQFTPPPPSGGQITAFVPKTGVKYVFGQKKGVWDSYISFSMVKMNEKHRNTIETYLLIKKQSFPSCYAVCIKNSYENNSFYSRIGPKRGSGALISQCEGLLWVKMDVNLSKSI